MANKVLKFNATNSKDTIIISKDNLDIKTTTTNSFTFYNGFSSRRNSYVTYNRNVAFCMFELNIPTTITSGAWYDVCDLHVVPSARQFSRGYIYNSGVVGAVPTATLDVEFATTGKLRAYVDSIYAGKTLLVSTTILL